MKTELEPRQDQAFNNTKEDANAYHKRGGVTHFVRHKDGIPVAVCKSRDGHTGTGDWKLVNCISCWRRRKQATDDLRRRGQPLGRFIS